MTLYSSKRKNLDNYNYDEDMAYLNKEQYAFRRESAARRAAENEAIAIEQGMTEEQAELISQLCSLWHELHTNMGKVVVSDIDLKIKNRLVRLNQDIKRSGLPPVPCIPPDYDGGDYIDIDDMDDVFMFDEWPESGTEEWQKKYDEEYHRIYGELSRLNNEIELYLADLDKNYGTSWCPTGALRIF